MSRANDTQTGSPNPKHPNQLRASRSLFALAIAGGVLLASPGFAQKIITNEFKRGGTFATDEYIELLILEPITATELNNYHFGDSLANTVAKNSDYKFQSMGTIRSGWEPGTFILIGGPTAVPVEDTSYNPAGGDWEIRLLFTNATFIQNVAAITGDFENRDICWADDAAAGGYGVDTVSANGWAAHYGGGVLGTFANNASVQNVGGTFGNNKSMQLGTDLAGASLATNWSESYVPDNTPAGPNPGQAVFIASLRGGPLWVDLIRFEALPARPGEPVTLVWETAAETDNIGFAIRRADQETAFAGRPTARLTVALIPSTATATEGAAYEWTDADPIAAEGEIRAYYLEDVDLAGNSWIHGPVWVNATAGPASVAEWYAYE